MLAKQTGHYPDPSSGRANLSVVHQHSRPAIGTAARAEGLLDSVAAMIWRRRKLVVCTMLLSIPLWGIFLLCSTPMYTTTASLLLQRKAVKFIRDGAPEAAVPDNNDYLYTQQRVITSTPVLAAAMAAPGVKDVGALRGHADALAILRKRVDVQVGKKDQLISIAFDSANPSDGVAVVSAVVDAYTRFNSSLRRNSGNEILSVLKEQKAQRDAEYVAQSHDLLVYSETHGLSGNATRGDVDAQRLQALSDALTAARLERVNAESSYEEVAAGLVADPIRAKKVAAFLKSSGAVLPSSSDEAVIRQEMLALKARQMELQQTFMPNHPAVVSLQRRIDELDIAFAAGVKHRLASAQAREVDLQKSFDQQQKVGFERAAQQDEYNNRRAALDRSAKLIELLDNNIKEVALTEDGGIPSVTTIESARASDAPTKPERTRSLAIFMITGFLLGSGLALFKEWGRLPVTTQSVAISLGVPVLGEMPPLSAHPVDAVHGQKLLVDSSSNVAEACRLLHGALASTQSSGRGATVLITSPSRGDGKTTLAVNMALALTAEDKRVLLVEADFRAPSLGRTFNITSATGLGTLLESSDPLPVTAIHHTGTPFLDLILAGPTRRNPSELLNGQAFIDLLGDLAERYDYVLLDSPPAVTFTDARTIAASCDATMLVIRGRAVNRPLFERAREGLINVGANLAGVMINAEGTMPTEDTGDRRENRSTVSQNRLMRTVRTMATAVDLM